MNPKLEREYNLKLAIDPIIEHLQELKDLAQENYEPYTIKQINLATRALLNIRGFKNLKTFNRVKPQ